MTARTTEPRHIGTPPLLLLAMLLFWGWLSGLLIFGAIMGVVLESSRLIRVRFDLSAEDFRRLWNFCGLLGLALLLYVFTMNDEGGGPGNLSHGRAMLSGIHAVTVIPRWLPMLLFLLVAAQNYSERGAIPLSEVSIIFRWLDRRTPGAKTSWDMNVSYPYFIVCLFSTGIHANDGSYTFLWGQGVLLAWALWPFRSRRSGLWLWGVAYLLAIVLAYCGARGIGQVEQLLQNYNAQWMARFLRHRTDAQEAMTSLGQIGEMELSSTIVVRLETTNNLPPPNYLREATYRGYHSQAWFAGEGNSEFDYVNAEPGGRAYEFVAGGSAVNLPTINIACYLNDWDKELGSAAGLLPLPSACGSLENVPSAVAAIKKNQNGDVLAAGPGLMIFDARYGASKTMDAPPQTNTDLTVPHIEMPAIQTVIQQMNLPTNINEQNEALVEQRVALFFANHYQYSLWQGPYFSKSTNETPLSRFLLQTHSGHCEYFATATVMVLRALKIPARYAVGFYVHEPDGVDHYVVRERDAHAWCLVWNMKRQRWEDFDTTPGSWVALQKERAPWLQPVWDFFSWLKFQFSKFRYGETHFRSYVLWLVIPVMAFLLYQIVFRRGRRRRNRQANERGANAVLWPGLDSEFYQLEKKLAARGVPRQPGEAQTDWIERLLREKTLADLREPLQELLELHYRHRFDPHGLPADERRALAEKVRAILQRLTEK